MDFTIKKYGQLLNALIESGYEFPSFKKYALSNEHALSSAMDVGQYQDGDSHSERAPESDDLLDWNLPNLQQKRVILRHDVDRLPENSFRLAQLEYDLGISGSYYFRIVPESYNLRIMNEIAALGHEIGYHYEDVDLAAPKRNNGMMERWSNGAGLERRTSASNIPLFQNSNIPAEGLIDAAYNSFCRNLEILRKDFEIVTACMHGSPRSKYDNRIIWQKYSYRDLGIIGEPYFDIDFNEFAYFTDSGRRWNGDKVTLRDKVNSQYSFDFKSTQQIIDGIEILPDNLMFTIHPQRWNDNLLPWAKELVGQNMKNVVKRVLVARSRA